MSTPIICEISQKIYMFTDLDRRQQNVAFTTEDLSSGTNSLRKAREQASLHIF